MKIQFRHIPFIWILLVLISCSKENEPLELNEDYLHVADVMEYCQGSCTDVLEWEGSEILLKGHIPDVENDSVVMEYYNSSRFYLSDIRNGMFMEVRVMQDKDAIFEILFSLGKQDMCFIMGTTESVIVNEGNECMKGVVVEIVKSENIIINL